MPFQTTPLPVTSADRATLEALSRTAKTEQRLALRARIVLQAAAGVGTRITIGPPDRWKMRNPHCLR